LQTSGNVCFAMMTWRMWPRRYRSREAMESRLALTAGSVAELQAYLAGENRIEGLHIGEIRRAKEARSAFAAGDMA